MCNGESKEMLVELGFQQKEGHKINYTTKTKDLRNVCESSSERVVDKTNMISSWKTTSIIEIDVTKLTLCLWNGGKGKLLGVHDSDDQIQNLIERKLMGRWTQQIFSGPFST